MICKMGGKWFYSCFVGCWFPDLFKTTQKFLVPFLPRFFPSVSALQFYWHDYCLKGFPFYFIRMIKFPSDWWPVNSNLYFSYLCCCRCGFGHFLKAGSGEMAQLFTRPALEPPAFNDHHHCFILIYYCMGDVLEPPPLSRHMVKDYSPYAVPLVDVICATFFCCHARLSRWRESLCLVALRHCIWWLLFIFDLCIPVKVGRI